MNWIRDVLRPKIKTLFTKIKDVPEDMWIPCPKCYALLYKKDIANHLNVCTKCGYHLPLPVGARFEMLFDDRSYKEVSVDSVKEDPLNFKDLKTYKSRIAQAREAAKTEDAISVAVGSVGGVKAVVAAMNFDFMGGSMGTYVGEAILAAARESVSQKAAFIMVTASGGARMQEGILSLMQMARTIIGVNLVRDAGLPYIVVMTNPTYGGVSASFAMLGDIHIAEQGAMIGFAGKRVIEQTLKKKLPDEFQTAEFLRERGGVDIVLNRHILKERLASILQILQVKKKGLLAKDKVEK